MTRMHRCLLCAWTVLLALPLSVLAAEDSKELLTPVRERAVSQLSAKSNYRLRAQLYPAKRYRFITINFDLLEDPQSTFTLTAFGDLSLKVATLSVESADPSGQLIDWRGTPVDTPIAASPPISLHVREGVQQVPADVARKMAATPVDGHSMSSQASSGQANAAPEPATVAVKLRTLHGEWMIPAKGARLVVMPVEDDPRIHVVYEVDADKVPSSAHGGADSERKLAERNRFMKQLESERAAEAAQRNN